MVTSQNGRPASRWNNYLPKVSEIDDATKEALVTSQYTSLARILDMNYSKVLNHSEVHVSNLTVDLLLPGFDLSLLGRGKVPKRRMKQKQTIEEKRLNILPNRELPKEFLESNFECIKCFTAKHEVVGPTCKTIIIRDRETLKEITIRSKFFLNL